MIGPLALARLTTCMPALYLLPPVQFGDRVPLCHAASRNGPARANPTLPTWNLLAVARGLLACYARPGPRAGVPRLVYDPALPCPPRLALPCTLLTSAVPPCRFLVVGIWSHSAGLTDGGLVGGRGVCTAR